MSEVASESGKYKNFTGSIDYKGTNCKVKDADFELLKRSKTFKDVHKIWLVINKGNVLSGNIACADILGGSLSEVYLSKSIFRDGVFCASAFQGSYWLGGDWVSGTWRGGYDKFGRYHSLPPDIWDFHPMSSSGGVADRAGAYYNFTGQIKWHDSNFVVKCASFELSDDLGFYNKIIIYDGIIVRGTARRCKIYYSVCKSAILDGCYWNDGIFEGGEFYFGEWHSGIWESGDWGGGVWFGGYDRVGYHCRKPPSEWTHIGEQYEFS